MTSNTMVIMQWNDGVYKMHMCMHPHTHIHTALVSLSLEHFQGQHTHKHSGPPQTLLASSPQRPQTLEELPASYGRKLPLTEEEIEIINVRKPLL